MQNTAVDLTNIFMDIQLALECAPINMSTVDPFPLKTALSERASPEDKIIVTRELLDSDEDFIATCLNDKRDKKRGYSHLKLDEDMMKDFCVSESDINKQRMTDYALLNKNEEIGNSLIGCNRYIIEGRRKISSVLGNSDYSVGDVPLSEIISNKKNYIPLFSLVKTKSVTDKETLDGELVGGVTHPTVQLSGGHSYLGDHNEHWFFASMNLHHFGKAKIWNVKPSTNYLLTITKMKSVQTSCQLENFHGVCESTLSHRDIFYPPSMLDCDNSVVIQEPGDIVIVHPSAIHNVENLGMNMAESRNYLPFEFIQCAASYKTCEHSEGLGGKPFFTKMNALIKDQPLEAFIHESDTLKEYKLMLIEKLREEGLHRELNDAATHIRRYHDIPEWFKKHLPLPLPVEYGPKKKYACDHCPYSTPNHGDLVKHIGRMHKGTEIPPNTNQEECPFCHIIIKCTRKHIKQKICQKRKRED